MLRNIATQGNHDNAPSNNVATPVDNYVVTHGTPAAWIGEHAKILNLPTPQYCMVGVAESFSMYKQTDLAMRFSSWSCLQRLC